MATVEGVHLRNSRYLLRILIPEDLQASYSGKTRVVKALNTSDLREANLRGLRLRLQWLEEFDTKRKALNPQKLESITPELAQALAEGIRRSVLTVDQGMRDGKHAWLTELSLAGAPIMRYPGWLNALRKRRDPQAVEGRGATPAIQSTAIPSL